MEEKHMTELEKLKAGLEYCYDDEEVDALKEHAMINTTILSQMPME